MLLDRLASNTAATGSKTAITYLGSGPNGGKVERKVTYAELEQKTIGLAHKLLRSGLKQGDR